MSNYNDERDVTFEIMEEIGVIATMDTGWTKELNLVRWNGSAAKYDIREWDPQHERMSRGITLKEEEMRRILDLMRRRRKNARSNGRRASDSSGAAAAEAMAAETAAETAAEAMAAAEADGPDAAEDTAAEQ